MLFRQEKKPFYDLHLHILPGMDDGARDLQMSAGMLREEIRQGCEGLIATPHYYPTESISDFLARRKRAFDELQGWIEEELPDWEGRIGLGAEAAYHNGLVCDPDLEKLCLGHSNYLLLEMPFEKWTSGMLRDVRTLIANGATVVVIEHDLDVIRSADYIIDMGPGGGEEGGRIVAAGTPAQIKATPESRTGRYI